MKIPLHQEVSNNGLMQIKHMYIVRRELVLRGTIDTAISINSKFGIVKESIGVLTVSSIFYFLS